MHEVKAVRTLSVLLIVLMAVQSTLGLIFSAEYRDVAWIAATWWGNDLVTLLVAVPLFVVALTLSSRGSVRGTLLWAGMLAYAAYNYAYYLLGAAMNRFFVLYVVCMLVAVSALILLLIGLDADQIAEIGFELGLRPASSAATSCSWQRGSQPSGWARGRPTPSPEGPHRWRPKHSSWSRRWISR